LLFRDIGSILIWPGWNIFHSRLRRSDPEQGGEPFPMQDHTRAKMLCRRAALFITS
jgi:hypothetical protein